MARTRRAGQLTPGTILADGAEVVTVDHDPDGCATVYATDDDRRIGVASDTKVRIL